MLVDLFDIKRTKIPSSEDEWGEQICDLIVSELHPLCDVLDDAHEDTRAVGWSLVDDVVEPFVNSLGRHRVHVDVDA